MIIKTVIRKLLLSYLLLSSSVILAAPVVWIDVRSQGEYLQEHVTGALNIPHKEIAERISTVVSNKDTEIYLYCGSGRRAGIAQEALQAAGYTQVKNIGGIKDALAMDQAQK